MANKEKEKEASYRVGKGGGTVKAAVDVGLGQEGFVSIALEDKKLFPGSKRAPLPPHTLGKRSSLVDKLLIVEARVSDVSRMTNKMSVSVNLTGGPVDKKVVSLDEVDNESDEIRFRTFVLFEE